MEVFKNLNCLIGSLLVILKFWWNKNILSENAYVFIILGFKISAKKIFAQNIWKKYLILDEIVLTWQKFRFFRKFRFFHQDFYLWRKFRYLTNVSIFWTKIFIILVFKTLLKTGSYYGILIISTYLPWYLILKILNIHPRTFRGHVIIWDA